MYIFRCLKCGKQIECISEKAHITCTSKCGHTMANYIGPVKEVSHQLKMKRLLSGFSQNDIAKAIGMTKPYISMLENGKVPLTSELSNRLNKLFGNKLPE